MELGLLFTFYCSFFRSASFVHYLLFCKMFHQRDYIVEMLLIEKVWYLRFSEVIYVFISYQSNIRYRFYVTDFYLHKLTKIQKLS